MAVTSGGVAPPGAARLGLAYLLALVAGLGVMDLTGVIFFLFGVSMSRLTGWMIALPFGLVACFLPYLCVLAIMRKGKFLGQGAHILGGAIVALIVVGFVALGLGGSSPSWVASYRTIASLLLAGGVAGFVFHAVANARSRPGVPRP